VAALVLLRNPLVPHTREVHEMAEGARVIDWLQEHYPKGFGMPVRFSVNGIEKPLDDLDHAMAPDDVAVIAVMPGGLPALSAVALNLIVSLVMAGVSYLLGQLFQPKQRSGAKGGDVSIYDVSNDQNAARLGDPIPVVYGSVLTTPDYISQPYNFYSWAISSYNQSYTGIQYLDMILCVGQGNIDVTALYLGSTLSATPDAGVVTWRAFKPAEHQQTMGVISSTMGGGFHENVITSPEVSNQEFNEKNDSAGFFATCKPGQTGSRFQIDIVFPGGLTDPDNSGDIKGRSVSWDVFYRLIDGNDAQVGPVYSKRLFANTSAARTNSGPDTVTIWSTSESEKNRSIIGNPLRRSYMITCPSSGRWAVKIVRVTDAPNAKDGQGRFIWSALRLYADYPAGQAYGKVTLVACRIKASHGMGGEASSRIRVRAVRRLPPPAGGAEAQSTSAADAFADIYTDPTYGAARPRAELDTAALTALRSRWVGYEFNYVFSDRITVWDALRTVTTPFAAEPMPSGQLMSAVQDGIKSVRTMLFTDANIVKDTFNVGYSFDQEGAPDGVEIEYLNASDFKQSYVRYPLASLKPDQFTLPGVTSATHAAQYARLAWQRRLGQRKSVTFDTEMEGVILQIGDRIGISHHVPKWGDSGLVIGLSGNTLTVDHDLDWTGGSKSIVLRRPDGGVTDPVLVSRGTSDNRVVLPGAPATTVNVDNDSEYTSFAFGNATMLVRDFIVTSVKPNGENTVTIEAVNYEPGIFSGAMGYL
jgi:hypothetical protein